MKGSVVLYSEDLFNYKYCLFLRASIDPLSSSDPLGLVSMKSKVLRVKFYLLLLQVRKDYTLPLQFTRMKLFFLVCPENPPFDS